MVNIRNSMVLLSHIDLLSYWTFVCLLQLPILGFWGRGHSGYGCGGGGSGSGDGGGSDRDSDGNDGDGGNGEDRGSDFREEMEHCFLARSHDLDPC